MKNGTFSFKDIFAVPVLDNYLIYAPLKQVSAMANKKAVLWLRGRMNGNISNDERSAALDDLLHLLTVRAPAIPEPFTDKVQPSFLGIIPTRSCNLSCVYCDFGADKASKERMSLATAVASVDWMAAHMQTIGRDTMEIHFFGGEPFVAGEIVDIVIHRARAVAARLGLTPRFEVSTNGVFDENRARFVGDYFDTAVLSFDGPKEVHDCHRPMSSIHGSFEEVARTAHILSQSPIELCFRACISNENVHIMPDIAGWFCEKFKPSTINFEILKPTPKSESAGLQAPDPYDFAVNYIRTRRVLENIGIQAVYAAAETGKPRHSFCPVGKDTMIVSPDGRVSSCYLPQQEWQARGLNMDIGQLGSDGAISIDQSAIGRLRQLVTEKPLCEHCFCSWTCAGGCHVSHTYPGSSLKHNDFCIQTRIITACCLMDNLDLSNETDCLISDRKAMKKLAMFPSDCPDDWKEVKDQ